MIEIVTTEIPDVLMLAPSVHTDARGFFFESFNAREFAAAVGRPWTFAQDAHSGSARGVLRGLHYQIMCPQGKLVRVARGRIFDVAVDLRRSSADFGHHVGVELDADAARQLWIPPGFAHGFVVLSEFAEVLYKATDYRYPEYERALLWNDRALGIDWPIANPTLSERDSHGATLAHAEVYP